jgi:hypothetical protein
MEQDIQKMHTALRTISLAPDEKAAIRSGLSLFMAEHPLPAQISVPSPYAERWIRSPFHTASLHTFRLVYVGLLIAVMIGGGVAAAAEGSLPGDTLYKMKVNVNEEVRAAVTISPIAKASWDATRAERRLEEAETLAVEGRLDATTTEELTARFEEHAAKSVDRASKSTDTSVKAAVHSELEAKLEAHTIVIDKLLETHEDLHEELASVRDSVATRAEVSENARISAEREINASTTAETKMTLQDLQGNLEEKIALLEEQTTDLSVGTTTASTSLSGEVSAKIEDSAETYAKASDLLEKGEIGDAFVAFQDALRTATEAEVLLNGQKIIGTQTEADTATSGDATASSTPVGDIPQIDGILPVKKEPNDTLPVEPLPQKAGINIVF